MILKYYRPLFIYLPHCITAVVRKKSPHHLGCLAHGSFNISVPRPAKESVEDWAGTLAVEGDTLTLNILFTSLTSYLMPFIRASIHPDWWGRDNGNYLLFDIFQTKILQEYVHKWIDINNWIIIMTALMLDRTTASFMMATNTITMVLLLIPLQYIFLSLILLVPPPTVPKSCRKDQYQQQHQLRRLHQHLQKMIVLICQTQGLFLTMIVELAAMRQMTMAKH